MCALVLGAGMDDDESMVMMTMRLRLLLLPVALGWGWPVANSGLGRQISLLFSLFLEDAKSLFFLVFWSWSIARGLEYLEWIWYFGCNLF